MDSCSVSVYFWLIFIHVLVNDRSYFFNYSVIVLEISALPILTCSFECAECYKLSRDALNLELSEPCNNLMSLYHTSNVSSRFYAISLYSQTIML